MSAYTRQLGEELPLDTRTRRVLAAAHVRDDVELISLLWSFPGLIVGQGLDAARLSNRAAGGLGRLAHDLAAAGLRPAETRAFPMGAAHAADAPWEPGKVVDLDEAATLTAMDEQVSAGAIDKIDGLTARWAIRDQGMRGTCVAFATAALLEHRELSAGAAGSDLSEQYLYWAIKTQTADPWHTIDGTTLGFARDALETTGVCTEPSWPYDPVPRPGNIPHESATEPPGHAHREAAALRHLGVHRTASTSGNARTLVAELSRCAPVAIALPVFRDSLQPQNNNWNTSVGLLYGRVLDPPPTSIVDSGHAVAVVGFAPDPGEPNGGYFIIRNSWGTGWGRLLPAVGSVASAPGYGQVSATYVEHFLWELYRL